MSSNGPNPVSKPPVLGARLPRLMALGASAFFFLVFAFAVNGRHVPWMDLRIMEAMYANAHPALDKGMVLITSLGSAMVLAPLEIAFLCWLLSRRKMAVAAFLSLAVGGAAILNSMLKSIFERQRPELWDTLVHESSYSFPSGHAMHSMALFLGLAIVSRGIKGYGIKMACCLAFALLVGCSRVYLGVHYPSDVLGGWLAAVAWVALCSVPFRWERLAR